MIETVCFGDPGEEGGTSIVDLVPKPAVYFAELNGQGILMDLVSNRYFGLTQLSALVWSGLQRGLATDRIAEGLARSEHRATIGPDLQLVRRQLHAWKRAQLEALPYRRISVGHDARDGAYDRQTHQGSIGDFWQPLRPGEKARATGHRRNWRRPRHTTFAAGIRPTPR